MPTYVNYIFIALVAGFFVRRHLKFRSLRTKVPTYLQQGAILVDVRSHGEFSGGHIKGSLNIPLQEIAKRSSELDKNKKILLCCASGSRSGMAVAILKSQGFQDVLNVGSWSNLI